MDQEFCLLGPEAWQNFYYCKYGTFPTIVHRPSGYINVTSLCSSNAKQFKHWHSLKNSKQTVADLVEAINMGGEHDILINVTGAVVCGTYAHPMLAPLILA